MGIMIGSARIDENGHISGGKAGDQTGKEISTQPFYIHKKGWYVLRPKSQDVAKSMGNAMLEACANNNIGYDQTNRYGIINMLKIYKTIKAIKEKTEADCSSTIRACCIQAGFDPGDFNTQNEVSVLSKTGKFEEKKTYTSGMKLYFGDVLVTKTKGHTVVVTQGESRTNGSGKPVNIIVKGCKGSDVVWVQNMLNLYGYKLKVDGIFGDKTLAAVKDFQKYHSLIVDGEVGPLTINALEKGLK